MTLPMKDAKSKDGADFTQLLKEGKCAKVPAPLVNFYWYFDEYSDLSGEKGYISEVAYLGYYKHLYTIAASLPPLIDVTYKPEHEKNPCHWTRAQYRDLPRSGFVCAFHDAMLQWIILRLGTALLKRKLDPTAATAAQQ